MLEPSLCLKPFTVSLFGHRQLTITPQMEETLVEIVKSLILEKDYVEFLIGRDGDFDVWAASVIKRVQKTVRRDNSSLTWVMPYLQSEYSNNAKSMDEYYSHVEVCEKAAQSHYKKSFTVRNQCMIDRSDLIIVCLTDNGGGVSIATKYANKTEKTVINIQNNLKHPPRIRK